MTRYTQIKKLDSPAALRDHLASLGVEMPVGDTADADGVLSTPVTFTDAGTRQFTIPNRFAVLPMEGWDCTTDGRPTDLVRRRWERFGASGCGLVWGEATAVIAEGRANPKQLIIAEHTIDEIAALRGLLADEQVTGLQLTHSGRWCRPVDVPQPRVAQRHPILDARGGVGPNDVISDDELDELAEHYIVAAGRVAAAGFDFVDVKACHGYLLHEMLGARNRAGRYGGDFAGRTRLFRTIIEGIRERVPGLAIALRLSAFDLVAHKPGPEGVGVPEDATGAPAPFGGSENGLAIDLTETHRFLELATELGIGLVSTTAGSPYYNPHIQRPAYFPPSDGYRPPEDPLVGVARQLSVTAELKARHPQITFVGSGYTYLQDWLPQVGQAVVESGGADLIGLGRMVLSYPHMAADVLAGKEFERRLICRTFSDCTTAPRGGLVSGCYPLDEFYKQRPERIELTAIKKRVREEQK